MISLTPSDSRYSDTPQPNKQENRVLGTGGSRSARSFPGGEEKPAFFVPLQCMVHSRTTFENRVRKDIGDGSQEVPERVGFRGESRGVGDGRGVGGDSLFGSQAFLFGFVGVARFGFGGSVCDVGVLCGWVIEWLIGWWMIG